MAAAASYRSVDLSRQVGAAIFSERGEIISLGCNEVPRARGGTYWSDDESDAHRDVDRGRDENHRQKIVILNDFMNRLEKSEMLSEIAFEKRNSAGSFEGMLDNELFKESRLMDIIEFGRMIHAEMSAIIDAARSGVGVRESILYCTTFPCHVCAKHIVAAGVKKVVFLEPYPKSYAKELHDDSISFDPAKSDTFVIFEPFIGISPRRYRDIFEKGRRKDAKGVATTWYEGVPAPQLEDRSPAYIENEASGMREALGALADDIDWSRIQSDAVSE